MAKNVPSSTVEKWRKLTNLVVSLSNKGALVWKETSEDDQYLASLDEYVIQLSKRHVIGDNNERTAVIEILLQDKSGKSIDEFNDEDISDLDHHNYFYALDQLLLSIERSLTGAEQVLDDLIFRLEKKDEDIPF